MEINWKTEVEYRKSNLKLKGERYIIEGHRKTSERLRKPRMQKSGHDRHKLLPWQNILIYLIYIDLTLSTLKCEGFYVFNLFNQVSNFLISLLNYLLYVVFLIIFLKAIHDTFLFIDKVWLMLNGLWDTLL